MPATWINVLLILLGGGLGLAFKNLISDRLMSILTHALGLCVLCIGIGSATGTQDMLCVIVCMVAGTVLGHAIDIERRLEGAGDFLRARLIRGKGGGRFTEGFVSASLLFCVGAMAITGSIDAGLNHDYGTIVSKGVIDGVTSISFAAAMGAGVLFSVIPLLLYQGSITLLAGWIGPYLPVAVITEMTAVGGVRIIALGVNMLELGREKIKVGNMLPAIFLPIAYLPLAGMLPFLS